MSEIKLRKSILDCKSVLSKIILKYNSDEQVRKHMQKVYSSKNMQRMRVNEILKNRIPIELVKDMEVGIWAYYLEQLGKEIKTSDYFTDEQIEGIKNYEKPDEDVSDPNTMVFKRVAYVNSQYLIPFVPIQDIARYFEDSLADWNPDTQRDSTIEVVDGVVERKPNINWDSVESIAKDIYENKFTANLITFNILKTNKPIPEECVKYNEETGTLIIKPFVDDNKKIRVSVIDGLHRTMASNRCIERAKIENVTLTGGFMLSITNFTVREAQAYIKREDKRNPLSYEFSQSLEKDQYNIFIENINEYKTSYENKMRDRIANMLDEVLLGNSKYTTIGILNQALKLTGLDFENNFDEYLEEFIPTFNAIIDFYNSKYNNNILDIKLNTIALEPNIFVGYVAIAKEILKIGRKRRLLNSFLKNQLNLDRNNMNWSNIDMYKKNPKSYKKIYDYFEREIKNYLTLVGDEYND